jgi:serine/threonine-protein kinase
VASARSQDATETQPGPWPAESTGTRAVTDVLAGRYRIAGVLGRGGLGTVYDAYDEELGRAVAIKELRGEWTITPSTLVREARALAAVRHPNVVTLHALHHDGTRAPFFVMEKVDGDSLDRLIGSRRLKLSTSLRLLSQIADGIDAIHDAGLVHGDIKPANVLVDRRWHAKVADLGLLPLLEQMKPGDVLGTAEYLPPERALGAVPDRALAPRADVYSFGVLAMELLTGRLPFEADTAERYVHFHAFESPLRPSRVSNLARAFDAPILAALEKDPARRPPRASHVAAALARAAHGASHDGSPLRVLVVDDDAEHRAIAAAMIAVHLRGTIVESASDGISALEALSRGPTVAVLDLNMPGLSGMALVREMRERAPHVDVIVATASGSSAECTRARALGVRRFFVKPVDATELCRAIRDLVEAQA